MAGFRRFRDHSNERPFDPPQPNIVRLDPAYVPAELPEPEFLEPIEADQELADAHHWDPDEAYRLAAWTWGHEFGVSWAAYVAGLPLGHRWTWDQVRELRFLRWLYQQGRS